MNVEMDEADAHLLCVLSCTTSEGQELQGRAVACPSSVSASNLPLASSLETLISRASEKIGPIEDPSSYRFVTRKCLPTCC